MIKLLVEPFDEPSSGGKRRRVADRVHIGPNLVEKALSKGTEEIVEYLVHDKGGWWHDVANGRWHASSWVHYGAVAVALGCGSLALRK